jgi:hypothetical protein
MSCCCSAFSATFGRMYGLFEGSWRMGKRKKNRITAENQRAFDERTKLIDEHIARKQRELEARRAQQASQA